MTAALHQIELMNDYDHSSVINFYIYLDGHKRARLFTPLPGWIGLVHPGADTTFDCRPFLLFETGKIDFGKQAESASRFGHIFWARLDRITVGGEISVDLRNSEEVYNVVKVSCV